MTRVPLTLACGNYDRVWPLADGRVSPEGVDLNLITLEPEECFFRMISNAEFDVAEMSLASYAIAKANGDDRFVGVPVFLSRSFRHSTIYVREGSDITEAADLAGRRVGVPEYQMTASVWTRALLRHDFNVDTTGIVWCTGGLEQAGRHERQPLTLPDWVHTEHVPGTLSQALVDGEIDALMAPRVPSVFREPASPVRRLWPDFAARETEYFGRTGMFPIMHMLVIRSDVDRAHPWLARSLYKAFSQAKQVALAGLADAPALRYTIPFLLDTLERQREVFGADPWPYGLAANRDILTKFIGYLVEQGLLAAPLDVDGLFAPGTRVESRI
ncbi:MAG TPA: ABC transporter substrate-binding protein [Pseudonocardiaceae bacterium]|jgi:4,5-dihydroxyphthalate decarboxylase|nr:ABC transporter substrate-binding protein [Pseudonocardiaceae bacterium]